MTPVRFTPEARTAIFSAVRLAEDSGCVAVEPACLAQALLVDYPVLAAMVLREMDIPESAFRRTVAGAMSLVPKGGGPRPPISSTLSGLIHTCVQNGTVTHECLFRALATEFRPPRASAPPSHPEIIEVPDTPETPVLPAGELPEPDRPNGRRGLRALTRFATNLNEKARQGKLPLVIGREVEIREVETALLRKTKCNPVLVGDTGVGKSAIVEGLVSRIYEGNVPEGLRNVIVYDLDVSCLLAGASARGEFEERVQAILHELEGHPDIVLFIDEFHKLVGAGGCGAMDAANMMKPAMARGAIRVIGATTNNEYAQIIESDAAFERRLQKVRVLEPSPEDTVTILLGIKHSYETFHRVTVDDDLVRLAVRLTNQYVPARRQPDKSIDLLDETMARARMERKTAVDEDLLRTILEKWTGIPASRLGAEEARNLLGMEERLARRVCGQDQAIAPVAEAIRRNLLHMSDNTGPIGSFLFVGPTGVGKTELSKAVAEEVMGDSKDLIRIDMSEYQAPHTVSRLFGAPPGYVGYGEGGQLTEAVRRRPNSVVLLDEIEKAHPNIFEAFLQVLDAGRMTDGQGRLVDFRHTVIIMTSNLGSRANAERRTPIGFTAPEPEEQAEAAVDEAVNAFFSQEFRNRLDGIIHFRPLDRNLLVTIAGKQLSELQERLSEEGYTVSFDENLPVWIAAEDAQPEFGARPIKRVIKHSIEGPLSKAFLSVEHPTERRWEVRLDNGQVSVRSCGTVFND